jgi:hypothetical protein
MRRWIWDVRVDFLPISFYHTLAEMRGIFFIGEKTDEN